MVQSTFQHWTYKQDTITFLWINLPYQKQHSTHLLANMNIWKYPSDLYKPQCILPKTHDRHLKGYHLHHCLPRWHHHLQQNSRRTSYSHSTSLQEITDSTSLHETQQMSFFHQGNTVARTHSQHKRHLTTSIKKSSYQQYACTKNTQTGTCTFLGLVRYYGKFIRNFAENSKTTVDTLNPASKQHSIGHQLIIMLS